MDCPPGQKKSGHYREVAVMERWPLVEVRLYCNKRKLSKPSLVNLGKWHRETIPFCQRE